MEQDKISLDRIDELLRLAFAELKKTGGRGRPKEILAAIEGPANISQYERTQTRSGAVRWQTHVRFYTSDCVKAGYLKKSGGHWILTEQGEDALKLPNG